MRVPTKLYQLLWLLSGLILIWFIPATRIEAHNKPFPLIKQTSSKLFQAQSIFTSTQTIFLPFVVGGRNSTTNYQPTVQLLTESIQNTGGSTTIFLPILFKPECNFYIEPNLGVADARTNYTGVRPGDRVCIKAGSRKQLILRNFIGTAEQPITFINFGGQVVFNQTSDSGIRIQNSRFIHLTGTGQPGINYGFKVDGSYSAGIKLRDKSSDFEIDHIEITRVSLAGIYAKSDANCNNGSTNNFDFDNDGKIIGDLDDIVNRSTFTQYNSVFHHIYIHSIGGEGFYIGSSFYSEGETINCSNGAQIVAPPILKGVQVYENILEDTGADSIQVGSTTDNCNIKYNKIYRDSRRNEEFQRSGIMNNRGSVCNIYNNFIKDGNGPGITIQGNGNNKIYNNIIVNSGQVVGPGYGMRIERGSNTNNNIYVWNNTIIRPKHIGLVFENRSGTDNKIQNNVIIQPGDGDQAYIHLDQQTKVTVSNNFTTLNITEAKFTNPALDDYSTTLTSPIVDTGINLVDQGITTDYSNQIRPQGIKFDRGAYEFTSTTPTPTSTSTPVTATPTPTYTLTPTTTVTPLPPTATFVPTDTPTLLPPTPTDTPTALPATPTDTPTPPSGTATPSLPPTETATPIG